MTPPKIDPAYLHPSRVIAKGRRIRDLPRLLAAYGGTRSGWTTRSGPRFVEGHRHWEIHGYHHHAIGSYEHRRALKR